MTQGWLAVLVLCVAAPVYAAPYESGGKVDEYVGAYTDTLPITVPPFHGIEPKLSLQYHSGRGSGLVGVGWSLRGLSVIERTDGLYGPLAPTFEIDGQLLIECSRHLDWTPGGPRSPACTGGARTVNPTFYTTLSETYLRIEHGIDPLDSQDTWIVWRPDGVTHEYKRAAGNTGRWLLHEVVDTSGNTVTYEWHERFGANVTSKEFNAPYKISYNGTVIHFGYAKRGLADTMAEQGLLETLDETVAFIDVCVDPDPASRVECDVTGADSRRARIYELGYRESKASGRPLLSRVQMFGKDAVVNLRTDKYGEIDAVEISGTSTPWISITWNDKAATFGWIDPAPIWNWGRMGDMVDYDGDGRADYCRDDTGNKYANVKCAFATGTSAVEKWVGQIDDKGDLGTWTDWNGDGRADYCRLVLRDTQGNSWEQGETRSYRLKCGLSTGTGMDDVQIGAPFVTGEHGSLGYAWFTDWNGDGRADYCRAFDDGKKKLYCAFSTGTSYEDHPVGQFDDLYGSLSLDDLLGDESTRAMTDWNGDGRADFCRVADEYLWIPLSGAKSTGNEVLKCLFSRTDLFDREKLPDSNATYHDNTIGVIDDVGSAGSQWWVDVNGDGKTDFCRLIGSFQIDCAISKQLSLTNVHWGNSPDKFGADVTRRWGDVDGDGRMDLCYDAPGAMKSCAMSRGLTSTVVQTGLIRISTHAEGRHWMADWKGDGRADYCFNSDSAGEAGSNLTCMIVNENVTPDLATQFDNGIGGRTYVEYSPSHAFAPSHIKTTVVASVTKSGTAEGPLTKTFRYSGPARDGFSRRFLGFANVRITDPCLAYESVCPYTEIASRMDWRWPTAPSRISRYANNREVTRREMTYADTTLRPYRSDLTVDTETELDSVDQITKQRRFGYDAFGNVNRVDDDGVIADTTGYFGSPSADDRSIVTTFVANPATYVTNKPSQITTWDPQGLLTDTRFVYDGQAWGDMPTRGLATEVLHWLDTNNSFVATRATFDAFGNVTSERDRNGYTTTYEIDPVFHQYVTKTTLPPAGTPVVARSTSTPLADWDLQCGARRRETQDQTGAVTVTTHDALCRKTRTDLPGGGYEIVGYQLGPVGGYTETQLPGSRWSRSSFDALGREVQATRSGGIVEKDITFDKRGNVATSARPRYDSDPAYYYTFTYDVRDRQTTMVLPSRVVNGKYHPGENKRTTYQLMTTISYDAMNHAEWTVSDVRGRRVMTASTNGMLLPRDLTKYTYDRRGNLEQIEQPTHQGTATALTRYGYDSLGRKTWSMESNGGAHTFGYDLNGNLTLDTDTNSNVTTRYWYDGLDRRVTKIAPYCGLQPCSDAMRTDWRYDEPRAGFQNVGHLTSMTDAHGTATYDHDIAGNLVRGGRSVDGVPYTFDKRYDISGRLLATTYPDGSTVGTLMQPIEYDYAGRVARVPGIIQSASYDAAGTLTSYTAPSGAKATYDTANPRGDVDAYSFDGPTSTAPNVVLGDFDGGNTANATTRYTELAVMPVLAAGQVLTVSTCAAGVPLASGSGDTFLRVFYIPNAGSQMIELASNDNSYVSGCGALSTLTVRAPAAGRFFVRAGCAGNAICSGTVAARVENDGTNIALNKTVYASSVADPTCGPSQHVVDGNANAVWCSGSSMLHTLYQPQPWMIIDLGADQDIARIDVFNRNDCDPTCLARLKNFDIQLLAENFAGGWQTVATVVDQAQWPTSVRVVKRARYMLLRLRGTDYLNVPEVRIVGPGAPGATLASSPVFQRTTILRDLEGRIARIDSNLARSSWRYTYSPDHTHELWSADNQADPSLSRSSASDNGNLYFDNQPVTYGYGTALPHALTSNENTWFDYDANGHMSYEPSHGTLTWSRTHQLVDYGGVTYFYDGDGYRLKKRTGYETKIYLGDDYEISSAGHTKYISLGGRLVAKQIGNAPATTLFTDHLGSVVLGLDGTGALAQSASYGPWGETITGDDEGRGYTGQYKDENGLLYLHARFYNPQIGRFISPDVMISSSHPIGVNRYAYAFNDPINHSDIDGLGGIANINNDLTNAMGATSKFLATTNVIDHMDFFARELGIDRQSDLRKVMNFDFGVGNTLALTFQKFYALGRGDYGGFAKAAASEFVISAAIAVSIYTSGATSYYLPEATALAASICAGIGLGVTAHTAFFLTLINTEGDFKAAWGAELKELLAIGGTASGLGAHPLKQDAKDRMKNFLYGGKDGPIWVGAMFSGIMAAVAADPYVALQSSAQAVSITPQGQLSSGTGTLFGYGYKP